MFIFHTGTVGVFRDDKRPEKEHEDPVSMAIGEFGRWQAMLTIILSLLNLPCTWHIFVPTFQGADTDFWCTPPAGVLDRMSVEQWKNLSGVFPVSPNEVRCTCTVISRTDVKGRQGRDRNNVQVTTSGSKRRIRSIIIR